MSSAWSGSSTISRPSSVSITSSMVTIPEIPPNASTTTMAMCSRASRKRSKRSGIGKSSPTTRMSRRIVWIGAAPSSSTREAHWSFFST